MTADWTPFDFIVNGEFADPRHIRAVLERVRDAASAECALLLVHQAAEFFQPLLYVSHPVPREKRRLQASLVEAQLDDDDKQALRQLLVDRSADDLVEQFSRSPDQGHCKVDLGGVGVK